MACGPRAWDRDRVGGVYMAVAEDGVDGDEPFLFLFFGSFGTGAVG